MERYRNFQAMGRLVNALRTLLEDRSNWNSNKSEITQKYTYMKDVLKRLYKKKPDTLNDENSNFEAFLEDGFLSCKALRRSLPSERMYKSVYDVTDYLTYWESLE